MERLLSERVHGGLALRHLSELALEPREVVDFSVNLNPYGPCEPVQKAARMADLTEYPDPSALAARTAWARALGMQPDSIVVGHGAADLLWAIVRAFVHADDRVVVAEPTFSEMRMAAAAARARVLRVFTRDPALRLDFERVAHEARGARIVYVCAPNNPTGEGIALEQLESLASALGSTLLVVDQSFLSLSDHAHHLEKALPANVLLLRSLTKDYALAGLRIGYLVAAPELARAIERARPTWATSAPALAAIESAAGQRAFVRASWQRMRADREHLRAGLRALGFAPLDGVAGYSLVPVRDAGLAVRELLRHKVFVRDASSFGLKDHVRVAARPQADTDRLLEAFRSTQRQLL